MMPPGAFAFDPKANDEINALTYGDEWNQTVTYTVTDADGETATSILKLSATAKPLTFDLKPVGASVEEGSVQTYTVTASEPVKEETKVVFTLVPVGGADTNTNGTNTSDFAQGAFNPTTVTIPVGGTTATFNVAPRNDSVTELPESYTVRAVVAGVTLEQTGDVLDGTSAEVIGQTFMLTKGLDNVAGTSGNDTIIGSIDSGAGANAELNTLSSIDIINGGAGTDTLKVAHASGTVTLGSLSNVEIVEIDSADAAGMTVNSSSISGITNLNVVKAAGVVSATAGATTDVSVAMKSAGAAVGVVGGNNVTVKLTDVAAAADAVTIGAGTAPKGDVVVEMTGKAYTTAAATPR